MAYHVTLSAKKPLFEILVAVFSNIILQKRGSDAGQLFPSSHVWDDRPSSQKKIYRVKGPLFQQNSTFDHLYLLKSKSRKIIPDVASIDNFNLHRKRSFIDQQTENSPPIRRFTKF